LRKFLSGLFLETQAAQFHIGHVVGPNDGRLGLHRDIVVGLFAAIAGLMAGIVLHAHPVVHDSQDQIDEHNYVNVIIATIANLVN
jgi:hypothetical protein